MAEPDSFSDYSHVFRVGSLFLALPAIDGSNDAIGPVPEPAFFYRKVLQALDADNRVKHLDPRPSDKAENAVTMVHVATAQRGEREHRGGDVPPPHHHVHVAKFDSPIVMKVNIPRRLQPQDRGEKGIPTEDYLVAWDGMELVVMWQYDPATSPSGSYGGVAVLDLLADAAKKAGVRTRSQPCGPNCDFPFAHMDVLLAQDDTVSDLLLTTKSRTIIEARFPVVTDETKLARAIARRLGFTMRTFSRMRAFGASVLASESQARKEVGDLLMLQYKQANAASKPFLKSIPERIQNRVIPQQMALLTSGLWLRLATLEQNRRAWGEVKHIYDTSTSASGFDLLFSVEYPQEVNSVEGVEIGNLRSAVEQMTLRADNRVVALATLAGAIAGGLIAGIVALIVAVVSGGTVPT